MTIDLILFGTTILAGLYMMQLLLAIVNASKKIGIGSFIGSPVKETTILAVLFKGADNITRTWTTIGVTLVIPVGLSGVFYIADMRAGSGASAGIFSVCVSILLVLVTLELSLANELYDDAASPWRRLLSIALGLDIISLFFLNFAVKKYAMNISSVGWDEVVRYVLAIGTAAALASFAIILFARTSRESL